MYHGKRASRIQGTGAACRAYELCRQEPGADVPQRGHCAAWLLYSCSGHCASCAGRAYVRQLLPLHVTTATCLTIHNVSKTRHSFVVVLYLHYNPESRYGVNCFINHQFIRGSGRSLHSPIPRYYFGEKNN
jgi:hypothetical protein